MAPFSRCDAFDHRHYNHHHDHEHSNEVLWQKPDRLLEANDNDGRADRKSAVATESDKKWAAAEGARRWAKDESARRWAKDEGAKDKRHRHSDESHEKHRNSDESHEKPHDIKARAKRIRRSLVSVFKNNVDEARRERDERRDARWSRVRAIFSRDQAAKGEAKDGGNFVKAAWGEGAKKFDTVKAKLSQLVKRRDRRSLISRWDAALGRNENDRRDRKTKFCEIASRLRHNNDTRDENARWRSDNEAKWRSNANQWKTDNKAKDNKGSHLRTKIFQRIDAATRKGDDGDDKRLLGRLLRRNDDKQTKADGKKEADGANDGFVRARINKWRERKSKVADFFRRDDRVADDKWKRP